MVFSDLPSSFKAFYLNSLKQMFEEYLNRMRLYGEKDGNFIFSKRGRLNFYYSKPMNKDKQIVMHGTLPEEFEIPDSLEDGSFLMVYLSNGSLKVSLLDCISSSHPFTLNQEDLLNYGINFNKLFEKCEVLIQENN